MLHFLEARDDERGPAHAVDTRGASPHTRIIICPLRQFYPHSRDAEREGEANILSTSSDDRKHAYFRDASAVVTVHQLVAIGEILQLTVWTLHRGSSGHPGAAGDLLGSTATGWQSQVGGLHLWSGKARGEYQLRVERKSWEGQPSGKSFNGTTPAAFAMLSATEVETRSENQEIEV